MSRHPAEKGREPLSIYTVAQAAAKLQVHEETIRRAYRTRQLRYVRIGRSVRIREDALQEWLSHAEIAAQK